MRFETPQDVEDAYYDALESADPMAMEQVWEDSEEVACLLPMTPLVMGSEVRRLWQAIFAQVGAFDIQVRHLAWIEAGETAIHLVEERLQDAAPGRSPPPIYGTNIYRHGADGWRLLLHQSSPTPPPPSLTGV
jgi:ketosteroid isomerase-like protein